MQPNSRARELVINDSLAQNEGAQTVADLCALMVSVFKVNSPVSSDSASIAHNSTAISAATAATICSL